MSDSLVQDAAIRVFADLSPPATVNAAESGTWPTKLWDAVAAAGFLDAIGDGEDGSLAGLADAAAVLGAAGRHAVPLPLADTMLARWLLRRAKLTVPDGPLAIVVEGGDDRVDLVRTGGSWRLSGAIGAVPWARDAKALVIATGSKVALVAPLRAAIEKRTNLAGEPCDAVSLDVTLAADKIAQAPAGTDAATVYRLGALLRAIEMAGALEEMLTLTVTYANDRVQFGRPIGKFQAVQQQLALAAEQVAAACVAVSAGIAGAIGGDLAFTAGAAKLRAGEAAGRVADIVHQVHGAIGFTHEHRLHHLTRRLWSWRDEFGHEGFWALELGRLAAAQGADGLWPFFAAR